MAGPPMAAIGATAIAMAAIQAAMAPEALVTTAAPARGAAVRVPWPGCPSGRT
jgi:hypothetical protein